MFDFIRRFTEKPDDSKNIAKKRLQLVLLQDRVNIRPETLEALKNDLITTIGKHLDIDREAMEVNLTKEEDQVAIVANIPVNISRKQVS